MRKLAALTLLVALGACADHAPTEPLLAEAAGTYTLRSIDGSPLPFAYLETAEWKDEVMSGYVTLGANGRFRDETLYRRTRSATVS